MSRQPQALLSPAQAMEAYFDGLLAAPEVAPDYLVFRLARLDFALPAARVDTVLPWPPADALSPLPAHGWLGRMRQGDRAIDIADTAAHLLPRGHRADAAAAPQVLLLAGTTLGLACDAVVETEQRLDPQQVCWRGPHGTRRWLAGTLEALRCALIEPDELLAMLDRSRP